ncbi:MAG: addiction module protein [Candidatus Tectomicrobia bacterium]|nr:addiction module protein [Candidatus Tectomicrobia bacterium]
MELSTTLAEIVSLSVDERLRLVEAIWDSIAAETGQPEMTEAQREELERRLAAHTASPEDVISWEEVKAQALARARR